MRLKLNRYISLITAFLIIAAGFAAFPLKADASAEKIAALPMNKQYFRRTIGSFARADMVKHGVLASLTVAQAIEETGWGTSSLATKSNNLFGMATFGGWEGKVTYKGNICRSYDDALLFQQTDIDYKWRAYDNWIESIDDHGNLLATDYEGVKGEKDYKIACDLVADVYAPPSDPRNANYKNNLLSLIETYDLTEFDDINPNQYGVTAITMSDAKKELSIGSTYKLSANIIGTATQNPVWASTDASIAEVSQDGTVTAKNAGIALITASIGNREACCIVTVKSNAVTTDYVKVRESHSTSSEELGRFRNGTPITVTGPIVHTGAAVDAWYPVIGLTEDGRMVSGWTCADYIEITDANQPIEVANIAFNRYELNRDVNRTYQLKYAVAPAFAENQTLTWTSSDPSVATVENGLIKTHQYGTAIITATAASGVSKSCVVNVTDKTVKYSARAVTELYVRQEDNTSSGTIGTFLTGAIITITDNYSTEKGPISDDFYYAEGTMRGGATGAGYSTAQYIYLISKLDSSEPEPQPDDPDNPEEPVETIPDDYQFSDNTLAVKNGYLYGASLSSTVGELLERIADTTAAVYDENGNKLAASDRAATGCTLTLKAGDTVKRAVIVIKGDVDGSGELDSIDLLRVKRAIVGSLKPEGAYYMAALISGDREPGAIDYLLMKKHILGNYTIAQAPNE